MHGKWVRGLTLVIFIGTGACSTVKHAATAELTSWDPAALRTADELAAKLRAGGVKCQDYAPASVKGYDADYRKRIAQVPAAVASCDTHADEDLTFEVFEDGQHKQDFILAKQKMLCHVAAANGIEGFPGFAYVDGGSWVIEPDEQETADQIAPILGGQSKIAACDTAPKP